MMNVESMGDVSRPLNEAIFSIINICKSLRETYGSPTDTDTCSNYNQIRKYTKNAQQSLETSDTMIKEKLIHLDKCMEKLTVKKYNVEQQKKEKSKAMENLQTKQKSAEQSLRYSKQALEQAEENLELANYAMRAHQERMDSSEEMAETGMMLLAIPIFGWIAGENSNRIPSP